MKLRPTSQCDIGAETEKPLCVNGGEAAVLAKLVLS